MLEAKGFPKAQSYPEGIPSILERLWTQQVARDRRENRSAQVRSHLENEIRMAQCDLDTVTIQTGRPYRLRCTKNLASHHRRVRHYEEDLENLTELRSIRLRVSGTPSQTT